MIERDENKLDVAVLIICDILMFTGIVLFLGIFMSGCTTLEIESGKFKASRTAWFYNVEADVTLKTPDGAEVSAQGLKSTVDTQTLQALIGIAKAGKP